MTAPNVNPPTSSGWKVTGTVETMLPDSTGRYVTGYQVAFVTGDGNSGTVFLPRDRFSSQTVAAAVAEHAANLDGVNNLKG
jgi:hypothetical protein